MPIVQSNIIKYNQKSIGIFLPNKFAWMPVKVYPSSNPVFDVQLCKKVVHNKKAVGQ
jgi:hypothetical protein